METVLVYLFTCEVTACALTFCVHSDDEVGAGDRLNFAGFGVVEAAPSVEHPWTVFIICSRQDRVIRQNANERKTRVGGGGGKECRERLWQTNEAGC